MNVSPASQGLLGIQRGMQGMQKAAEEIASTKGEHAQLTEAMVNLKAQANLVEAATKVVKTSDDMLGSVLDIMA